MVFLGWLQLGLLLLAAGILAGAVVGRLALQGWLERMERVAPKLRFVLLAGLAMMPLLAGLAAVAVGFGPSVLDGLGLIRDHCAHHGGHAFHLCFVHGHPPEVSGLLLGSSVVVLLWLAAGWGDELSRVRQAQRWGRGISSVSEFDDGVGTFDSERAVAVTVGLVLPRVYVSEALRALLSPTQIDAVVAHEKAHARRFDALVKVVIRLTAQLHAPSVRERLLGEADLACEQACDEAAAAAVGDRLTVAEALLAVERASGPDVVPASALAFGAGALDRRVRGLLDDDWRAPRWTGLFVTIGAAVGVLVAASDLLHHTAESLLAYLF